MTPTLTLPERRERVRALAEHYRSETALSPFRPILAGYVQALSPLPGWLALLTLADYVTAVDSGDDVEAQRQVDVLTGVGL